MRTGTIAADIIKGAIAGAAATWAMSQVTTWLYAREDPAAREREDRARAGRTAYGVAAERAARAVDVELTDEQRQSAGAALHWALGIGGGIVYALARRRMRAMARGQGLLYGLGFFMVVDELVNPLMGLTPGPAAFPWQAHARGLGGHLTFGAVNETALQGLDCVA